MNKLISELQRLYFLPDQQWQRQSLLAAADLSAPAHGPLSEEALTTSLAGEAAVLLTLVSPAATARAMVVSFKRASAWEQVAKLYQAVQHDLALPAPAVSVSGREGYRLWFSLAEPLPVAQVRSFLNALHQKYLAEMPIASLEFQPAPLSAEPDLIKLPPALHPASGRWSAFIDPTMGSMFIEEAGLEMAPNLDKQADMLAGLRCIKSGDFQQALALLEDAAKTDALFKSAATPGAATSPNEAVSPLDFALGRSRAKLNVGNNYSDPQSFLLAVMNDATATPRQRIAAAKALLPYFAKGAPE